MGSMGPPGGARLAGPPHMNGPIGIKIKGDAARYPQPRCWCRPPAHTVTRADFWGLSQLPTPSVWSPSSSSHPSHPWSIRVGRTHYSFCGVGLLGWTSRLVHPELLFFHFFCWQRILHWSTRGPELFTSTSQVGAICAPIPKILI